MISYEDPVFSETCDLYHEIDRLKSAIEAAEARAEQQKAEFQATVEKMLWAAKQEKKLAEPSPEEGELDLLDIALCRKERAERAEAEIKTILSEILVQISVHVITPLEGYGSNSNWALRDLEKFRRMFDQYYHFWASQQAQKEKDAKVKRLEQERKAVPPPPPPPREDVAAGCGAIKIEAWP